MVFFVVLFVFVVVFVVFVVVVVVLDVVVVFWCCFGGVLWLNSWC